MINSRELSRSLCGLICLALSACVGDAAMNSAVDTISADDLDLITIVDEPMDVVNTIFDHYENRDFELSAEEQEIMLEL